MILLMSAVITAPLFGTAAVARLCLHSRLSLSLLFPLLFPLYNSSFLVSLTKGEKKKAILVWFAVLQR